MIAFNATPSCCEELLSGHDILIFALGLFIWVTILLWYYNRVSKSNNSNSVNKSKSTYVGLGTNIKRSGAESTKGSGSGNRPTKKGNN